VAIDLIGWDIGGAHLKAAALEQGRIVAVTQHACPLWLGIQHFHAAARAILDGWRPAAACRHAVTMTGELADCFASREDGVFGLLQALREQVPAADIQVFAGLHGWLAAEQVGAADVLAVASANWLATGMYAATQTAQALLVDIGSTTTDLLVLREGKVCAQGYTDFDRLRHEELVYAGAVRTSLMALCDRAPLDGEWIGLMAEHFATTADVYRLTGELPGHADQMPTADGGEKTEAASARRIARLLGRDLDSADAASWRRLACYFRERQLARLADACQRQLSRGLLDSRSPFFGAGTGRFLAQELAVRLGHDYLDFTDLFAINCLPSGLLLADCAPAVALACLARHDHG
jgi:probable H4MPT-linked C1 transfer pathway protein